MKFHITLICVCLLAAGNAIAHQDSVLSIAKNGNLAELPAQFQPASLNITFAKASDATVPVTSVVLKLGRKEIVLPACVTRLLASRNLGQVSVSASWYHDLAVLPPYLSLLFYEPGYAKETWANSGIAMMFDLRSGKILSIRRQLVADGGNSLHQGKLYLAPCSVDELKAFSDLKTR
jgi:hypothetical protein